MNFMKFAALLSLFLLPACEGPALFVSPLEPTRDTALDDRLLGAWYYVGSNTSTEWSAITEKFTFDGEESEEITYPEHWQETISLVVVPETSHTLSAIFNYSHVTQSIFPGEGELGWGRMERGWLALSARGTEFEDQIFFSAKSEGGQISSQQKDTTLLGPHEQFYIARVTLLDDDHLEIAPIWSHVVDRYLGSGQDDFDRLEHSVSLRCGWNCGVDAYELSNEQIRELISRYSEDISKTAVVFTRAPGVNSSVFLNP